MGLVDLLLRAVDADYAAQRKFTSEPGTFAVGNRVKDEGPSYRGRQAKPRFWEVTRVERRYERDGNHWDQGWARPVDSLRGCNCGHPGCPG